MVNFEIAAAIMIVTVMFFLYKASVELDERHWQLKMGFFYGALAIGWAGLNVVLRMAADSSASQLMQTAVTAAYGAYTTIGILAVIYLGLRFFMYAFSLLLGVARRKELSKEEQAW